MEEQTSIWECGLLFAEAVRQNFREVEKLGQEIELNGASWQGEKADEQQALYTLEDLQQLWLPIVRGLFGTRKPLRAGRRFFYVDSTHQAQYEVDGYPAVKYEEVFTGEEWAKTPNLRVPFKVRGEVRQMTLSAKDQERWVAEELEAKVDEFLQSLGQGVEEGSAKKRKRGEGGEDGDGPNDSGDEGIAVGKNNKRRRVAIQETRGGLRPSVLEYEDMKYYNTYPDSNWEHCKLTRPATVAGWPGWNAIRAMHNTPHRDRCVLPFIPPPSRPEART